MAAAGPVLWVLTLLSRQLQCARPNSHEQQKVPDMLLLFLAGCCALGPAGQCSGLLVGSVQFA
jgi:hypothetical protein